MSGRIINISGANPVNDPSYRYKMPSVVGKVEGKGNGVKTVVANIMELAVALKRDPAEVNKFFGCEMGAQTTFNETTDKAVVNGAHTDLKMQECIHKYVEKFVLCPYCGLPETIYSIKPKQGEIWHRCGACGAKELVDMNHKLCSFIFARFKKVKDDEKAAEKAKAKAKKKKGGTGAGAGDASDEEKEKKKKDKKKKKEKEKGSDDEKKEKKKKDKKKKDKKKKDKKDKDSAGSPAESEDDASAGVDDEGVRVLAIEGIRNFIKENPTASAAEVADVVCNQQMASALKTPERIHIFLRAAITADFFKNGEIAKNGPVIEAITNDSPIMQRHLISAIEGVCTLKEGIGAKFFPVMLKQLFEEDLLSEDVIAEWAFDGRTEYTLDSVTEEQRSSLRGQAEPVVAWLQDESDSDSDSD